MSTTQILTGLEELIDEAVKKAIDRALNQPRAPERNWLEGSEAETYMGAGYTLKKLKEMANQGLIVADRKDPDKPNSPYIFWKQSLDDWNTRRVFQIDQKEV